MIFAAHPLSASFLMRDDKTTPNPVLYPYLPAVGFSLAYECA
ncbi:MAG: hypothetical protein Q8S33_24880 [Myxococcales bacterium]|nr:hypothetical protein [Myxococcales bacterium]